MLAEAIQKIGFITFSFFITAGLIGFVLAWTDPDSNPPLNNTSNPINIGEDAQIKTGGLSAAELTSFNSDSCNAGILNLIDASNNSNWHFTSRKPGCGGNNDFALWHFTGTNPGSGQSSDAWYGPYLWISKASGNVGIGASSPLYKLTVSGQGHFSQDNLSVPNGSSDFTLTLAENTAGPEASGRKASLQFHNSQESEGRLKLNSGPNGTELLAESVQTDMDLRATGLVRGDQGLCIAEDCRSQWPLSLNIMSCPAGQYASGIDTNGDLVCQEADSVIFRVNPCQSSLPSGGKRIFVTKNVFAGDEISSETQADQKCQNAATAGGYPGIYKALIYMGNRNLEDVFAPGATFWNGAAFGTTACNWNLIAVGANDFFTYDENSDYLPNPIKYNEEGLESSVNVWTNFRPLGSGNYQVLSLAYSSSCGWSGPCLASINRLGVCNCAWWGGACDYVWAMKAQAIYGSNTAKNSGWANNGMLDYSAQACTTSPCSQNAKTQCAANSMSLYCVEQ